MKTPRETDGAFLNRDKKSEYRTQKNKAGNQQESVSVLPSFTTSGKKVIVCADSEFRWSPELMLPRQR